MSAPARVIKLALPLQWAVDLDVRGFDVVLVAEVLANWPKRSRQRTYRALALRFSIYARLVQSDDVRRDLVRLIERCELIREQRFSLTGAALAARWPRDDVTVRALKQLTQDVRVLERL